MPLALGLIGILFIGAYLIFLYVYRFIPETNLSFERRAQKNTARGNEAEQVGGFFDKVVH